MNAIRKLLLVATPIGIGLALLSAANLAIIKLICCKKGLQQVRFYIVINLCVTNTVFLLNVFIGIVSNLFDDSVFTENNGNLLGVIIRSVAMCTHVTSLLTTAFLAIDRYIAVKHCLRYQSILTTKRMTFIVVVMWLVAVLLTGIQWINVSQPFDFRRNNFKTVTCLRIVISVLLLSVSKITTATRKMHMGKIEAKQKYFGVEKEKLDTLKLLKNSLKDSFKLYIATIVVMVILTVIGTIETIFSKNYIKIKMLLVTLLQLVELIVISLTQREIRLHLKHGFIMCGKSNTNPNVNNA